MRRWEEAAEKERKKVDELATKPPTPQAEERCSPRVEEFGEFLLSQQRDSATEPNKKRDCPFCILERRIARSLTFDLTLDSPAKIVNSLRIYAEHFQSGRQEDAHEFLRYVIDACHNTCLRLKKLQLRRKGGNGGGRENLGKTIVSDIFGGTLQNQVKCLSCGAESNKVDEIMDLSLDILHSNSIKESMQKFFQPEILDGNNKYKCDKCNKLVAARKQMSILQAPNVLVVQLKRFEGIFGRKIDKAIDFEEALFLSGFMCKANQSPRHEYSLFGTIVHSGFSPESGHYYAYIKDAIGRWFCCNDSCVTQSSVQEVLSERAYILFFARTSQRAGSSPIVSNGVKSHDSNGNGAVKNLKTVLPLRAVNVKSSVESSLAKSMQTEAKVDKVSFSLQTKFNGLTGSLSGKTSVSGNGQVDSHKIQPAKENGHHGNIIHQENGHLSAKENGSKMNGKNDAVNGDNGHGLANGNGHVHDGVDKSPNKDRHKNENNGATDTGWMSVNGAQSNGAVNGYVATSSLKRKENDSCTLSGEDVPSQTGLEELKEALQKEASSVLRSCGWTDEVYEYMRSKKRLRADDLASLAADESKNLLIEDARNAFQFKVPPSLKQGLITRLRSFSWDL
ncbi:hypothetical protein V2J09_012869 [Rumex salicifolius]